MSHNTLSPSAIDFLTSCSTGVDFIPGFAAVHYWVYTAEPLADSSKVTDQKSLEAALFEAEIALREQKLVLFYDEQRKALWFFSGATTFPSMPPSAITDGSTGLEKYGWASKIIFSGMFKAADISIHPARFAAMYSPGALAAAGAPPTPGGVPSPASNARAFQQNTAAIGPLSLNGTVSVPYDRNDIRTIYSFFMKGLQASFAYTLAKEREALQLDSTYFTKFPEKSSSTAVEDETPLPSPVFTINHSLANGGGMLVSTSLASGFALSSYEAPQQGQSASIEVIIAPGGSSAEVLMSVTKDQESAIQQWKILVRKQLRARGISMDALDPQDRWILLKTSANSSTGGEDATESTVFYWPQSLCFVRQPLTVGTFRGTSSRAALLRQPADLSWFLSTNDGGNDEPVSFAQSWYDGKAAREQAVQDRHIQEELQKKQLESATIGVTSPAYPRDGLLQATAGVYPTPPDGIPHANQAHGPQEIQNPPLPADQAAHRSSLDMQHSEMMDLDIGPFEENVRQRPSVVSRTSLDGGVKLVGDDLFGDDMVDEDLRGQDITDADFSFFDEPEGDDVMMLDDIEEEVEESHAKEGDNIRVEDFASPGESMNGLKLGEQSSAGNAQPRKSIGSQVPQTPVKGSLPAVSHGDDISMNDSEAAALKQNGVHEPLSPSAIRKKLFDFAITPAEAGRRGSQFQPLAFNTMMQINDAKYSMDGAFAFRMQGSQTGEGRSATSPYIKPRPPDQHRRLSLHPNASLTSPDQARYYDSDSSSDVSDKSDEDSVSGYGARSIVSSSTRAKWNDGAGSSGEDAQSMAGTTIIALEEFNVEVKDQSHVLASILHGKQSSIQAQSKEPLQPENEQQEQAPMLRRVLPSLLQTTGPLNPFHKDFINVAQLVAEQLAVGSVNATRDANGIPANSNLVRYEHNAIYTAQLRAMIKAVRLCHDDMSQCDLLRWICVQEPVPERQNVPKGHPLAQQKKTTIAGLQSLDGTPVLTTALAPLAPPHVRVRRNEGVWDVLPPALPFWEQLGLAPAAGKKNVMAFCIYPGTDALASQASIFLDYLGATFESCKLGAHVRATQVGEITMGLVPAKLPIDQTLQSALQAIRDTCVELGKLLAGIDWNSKLEFSPAIEDLNKIDNFVIYMIHPFEDEPRGLMELCAAFWELYEAYSQSITSPSLRTSQPDVVLQVLPVRHIANFQTPVVMDAHFHQKLAREVYDRCPPAAPDDSSSRLPIESAAAVQLEQPLPRKIDFKLQADPPTDLLHEGSNLHLGYSRSRNKEWVSVAWTETTGRFQATSNYCLVGGRSFAEVARVIWQSTIEIMQARRVAWRLCIARVGALEKEELDTWSMLATSASPVVMITVIMSVDPSPPISVFHDQGGLAKQSGQTASVSTPVGTPGPGVSPDAVLTPAATPSADAGPDLTNDPDAHLVDMGDETWGLILGHRTNITNSITDYRPSLSTGFLLKSNAASATALDDPDEAGLKGLILVGVKLVWIGSSPKPPPPPAAQPTGQQQSPHIPIQSPYTTGPSSSPTEMAAASAMGMPPTPSPTSTPGGQQQPVPGQLNTSTSGGSIPKVTADSILRDYLQMYRNLGVLARARGLKGTKRGALPWHVVVAMRAVEGLEASYGTMQMGS